jgi:hypothetical protein
VTKQFSKAEIVAPWVDVFSGVCFSGQLLRLHAGRTGSAEFEADQLPNLGSLIVGPNAVLKIKRQANTRTLRFSPKTILTDASGLAPGRQPLRLVVEAADV